MNNKYTSKLHKYIPGGAHTYSRGEDTLPSHIPSVLKKAKGCYMWDLDDNKFLDYGMGLRSCLLGFCNEIVDNAAIEEIKKGNNLTRPSETEYLAAKKIVDEIPFIDMLKFYQNFLLIQVI
jgi:glutamate-1-semialdehyde 2,1-aminomutase